METATESVYEEPDEHISPKVRWLRKRLAEAEKNIAEGRKYTRKDLGF